MPTPRGVDALPPTKGDNVYYGHVAVVERNGIYFLELISTGSHAKGGMNEIMFAVGQTCLTGTVQIIINAVAMWQVLCTLG